MNSTRATVGSTLTRQVCEARQGKQSHPANMLTLNAELRAAVQASLREKLASLDGDKWMYEEEDETAAQA